MHTWIFVQMNAENLKIYTAPALISHLTNKKKKVFDIKNQKTTL